MLELRSIVCCSLTINFILFDLLQSAGVIYIYRAIGVQGVRTPPVIGRVMSTYVWTPPEFLTT